MATVTILSSDVLAQKAEEAKRAAEEAKREAQRAKAEETKLSADEKESLRYAEEAIAEYHTSNWRFVAKALAEIHGRKLYRATHSSWEKYLRDRWDLLKRSVDQWILADSATSGMPELPRMSLTSALLLAGNSDSTKGIVTTQENRVTAWDVARKAAGTKKIVPADEVRKAMKPFVPARGTKEDDGPSEDTGANVIDVAEGTDTWELGAVTVAQLRKHGIQSATELTGIIEQLAELAGDETFDNFLRNRRNGDTE